MNFCKCIILSILFTIMVNTGFSRTFASIWYGAGYSMHDNYDLGTSYGINFYKAINYGIGVGFSTFIQQVNLYNNVANDNFNGGNIRMNASYYYFAPMIVAQLGKSGHFSAYLNGGLGVYEDGYTDVHTWSDVQWPIGASYDFTAKGHDNLSLIVFRLGVGFIQYYHLFGSFHLYVNEDIGISPTTLQNLGYNNQYYDNIKSTFNQFFSPTYFSIHLGLAYITNSKVKY